jgi:hypothetical protein
MISVLVIKITDSGFVPFGFCKNSIENLHVGNFHDRGMVQVSVLTVNITNHQ